MLAERLGKSRGALLSSGGAMSRKGFRPAQPVKVTWTVTAEKTLGGLTVKRFIDLHHLVGFGSDDEHQVALNGYRAPTDTDPYWYFQSAEGETWRVHIKGRFSYAFEVWWRYEWRARMRRSAPKWLTTLADCLDYGKKRTFVDGELVEPEQQALPAPDEEQQLTLF